MSTAKFNPRLEPMGRALSEAMDRAGVTKETVARAVKMSVTTVNNWRAAKSGIMEGNARKLGKLLQVDPATLRAPYTRAETAARAGKASQAQAKARTKSKVGRPPGRKNSKPRRVGPAQRAVALHAAHGSVHVLPPSRPPPGRLMGMVDETGVFGMRVDEAGLMHLWLRAALPFVKGAELLKVLLDFGLVTEKPVAPVTEERRETGDV